MKGAVIFHTGDIVRGPPMNRRYRIVEMNGQDIIVQRVTVSGALDRRCQRYRFHAEMLKPETKTEVNPPVDVEFAACGWAE